MIVNITYPELVRKIEKMKATKTRDTYIACVNEKQVELMHKLFYSLGVTNHPGWERAHLSKLEEKIEYIKKNKFIEFVYTANSFLRYDGGDGEHDISFSRDKKELVFFPLFNEQEEFE